MTYLLDTDIVSQYTKSQPNAQVDTWLERTDDRDLYLSTITIAELWSGIQQMPVGKRRTALETWVERELVAQFGSRILSVSWDAAQHYGRLSALCRRIGHEPQAFDVLIAAIAMANGMAVVTLNRKHFEPFGVPLATF